jgi:hypothetical protein
MSSPYWRGIAPSAFRALGLSGRAPAADAGSRSSDVRHFCGRQDVDRGAAQDGFARHAEDDRGGFVLSHRQGAARSQQA